MSWSASLKKHVPFLYVTEEYSLFCVRYHLLAQNPARLQTVYVLYMARMSFLSSLIIHQVKTKKFITVKEVWITGLNLHGF